jgi:hypothetical protein
VIKLIAMSSSNMMLDTDSFVTETRTSAVLPNNLLHDVVQEALCALPISSRIDLIFGWAYQFEKDPGHCNNLGVAEVFNGIASLDLSFWLCPTKQQGTLFARLPLSGLRHLNLSHSFPFGCNSLKPMLAAIASLPALNGLVSLNLSDVGDRIDIDILLSGPHHFPI